MKMSRVTKKLTAMMLASLFMISLFSGIPTCTFAANEIDSIVLKWDTVPKKGGNIEFATVPNSSDFTIIQVWLDDHTENKGFSNNEALNNTMTDSLLPETDRKFTDGGTYYFIVRITPNAGVTLAPNMQVSIEGYGNMELISDDDEMVYQLGLSIDGEHTHIKSSEYDSDDIYHRNLCVECNNTFDGTEDFHEYNGTSGYCTVCRHLLSDAYRTKINNAPATTQTATCGGALELTVTAYGINLEYDWKWKSKGATGSFYNDDNFRNIGIKVSGCGTDTLKIEDCNQNLEEYTIVCHVTGALGEAETEDISVGITHERAFCTSIDESYHKVLCRCGTVIKETEGHRSIVGSDKCGSCEHSNESTETRVREVTLNLKNFSNTNTVKEAKDTAALIGTGIKKVVTEQSVGIDKISFSCDSDMSDTTSFDKDVIYTVCIYPDFENGFYMDNTNPVYVHYNGKTYNPTPVAKSTPTSAGFTRTYYLELSLKPYVRHYIDVSEETDGSINIAAREDMKVTFVMAHYDINGCLKTLISKNMSLSAGDNTVTFTTAESKSLNNIVHREKTETVKMMIFDGINTLKPFTDAKEYKYLEQNNLWVKTKI